MLAVVYETFTTIEKEKMKKLYLHKHKGCELAYNLLVSKSNSKQLRFKLFQGLMRYFAPKKSNFLWSCHKCNIYTLKFSSMNFLLTGDRDIVIIFKYLNSSNSGILSKEEFNKTYDAVILHWEPQYANIPWYHSAWMPLQNVCQMAHTIISLKYFEYFFCKQVFSNTPSRLIFILYWVIVGILDVVILLNGLTMANRAFYMFDSENLEESAKALSASWDTVFFSGCKFLKNKSIWFVNCDRPET